MQFSADMNISYEELIHISDWILDSRPKKRLNFHTGQAEPGTRKTSCDVEIHCDARDIVNQYSKDHLPPQVKGRVSKKHFTITEKNTKTRSLVVSQLWSKVLED